MNHANQLLKYPVLLLLGFLFLFYSENYAFGRGAYVIEPPKLGVGIVYEFEDETRTGPDIDSKDTLHDLRAQLALETRGWLYHPALCEYNLRLFPEFSLRKEEHEFESKSKDSFMQGYFVDAAFLQYKPYNLRIFGQRIKVPVRSAFATTSDTEIDTYGADLNLSYNRWASVFSYGHREESQTGFFSSTEDADQFQVSGSHSIGKSWTSLDSIYEDKTRTSESVTNDTKTLDTNLRNTFNITDDRRIILRSHLKQRSNEINNSKNTGYLVSETLDWRHRENLRTDYRLNYSKNKIEDLFNDSLFMRAGLEHLLYENLTTRLSGDATFDDFTGGDVKTYGGDLDFDYRREIPWGDLLITTSLDYARSYRNITGDFIPVIDEAHTLTTGDLTLLDNENVLINSIRVTDITSTTVYIKDVDYNVEELGSEVRISRTIFGAIADGEPVLVSYGYQSNPDFNDEKFGQSYGLRLYLWSLLTLSGDYIGVKQSVISGVPPDNLIDDTAKRAKMELEWGPSYTKLRYEDIERQSGISTTEFEAEEKLTFSPFRRLFYGLEGHYGERKFKESGNVEDLYSLRVFADYIPFPSSKLRVEGVWTKVSGDSQKVLNTGLRAWFDMSLGLVRGRIKYEYLNEEDEIVGDTRKYHNILFEIVREVF
jgi:hypothetical protein